MPRNVQYSDNMWGLELRYLLWQFINTSVTPMTTAQLVERCDAEGIEFGGRASKVVSDALRWEVGRGRVERLGRGLYGPGVTPRSTEWWIRERAAKRLHLLRHYLDDTRSPHPMTAVRSTHRYTFLPASQRQIRKMDGHNSRN